MSQEIVPNNKGTEAEPISVTTSTTSTPEEFSQSLSTFRADALRTQNWHIAGVERINADHGRFKQIVHGKIRENMRKYVNHGEMIGRKDGDTVSVPIPSISPPIFRHGDNGNGGVGSAEGVEPGDPVGPSKKGQGKGKKGGSDPGEHTMEVDVSLPELAAILGNELELPNIEPRGHDSLQSQKQRYNSIRTQGPESLRHFRRSYFQALRRQIGSGEYNYERPKVEIIKADKRYRAGNPVPQLENSAAVVFMMDVSGSMGDEQKQIVRTAAFWIKTWLAAQYDGVKTRYIIHDAAAREVDEHTFFHTRESGGTRISAAYELTAKLFKKELPPNEYNLYAFHFSDGDNWGDDDTRALGVLKQEILPVVNLFCYGQVESEHGSGEFFDSIKGGLPKDTQNLALAEIRSREGIYNALKAFLGKGK